MSNTLGDELIAEAVQVGTVSGLHSSQQFNLLVQKERFRADRYRTIFSVVVFRLILNRESQRRTQLDCLNAILSERLRLSDERGLERNGDVVVLLPHTHEEGATNVADSIIKLSVDSGLVLSAKIYTYPELAHQSMNDGSSDSDRRFESPQATGTSSSVYEHETSSNATVSRSMATDVHYATISYGNALEKLVTPYPKWKRICDIVGASMGLVLAAPVLLTAAIAIKLTSSGPVLFHQWRNGRNGKPFRICKLRTMVVEAEELKAALRESNERDGPAFKMKHDPRVTTVGKFLRNTGLDELPQLWNVFKGDMAIVGPRPLPCDEDANCELWHRRRLDTKPGITCFWQIMKSRVEAFDDWMRLDMKYLKKRSLFQDISLMFRTIAAVVLGRVGH
jgi:lipopolysaccharide/colanic/teichoic acid biosynthesis glycosyltransferase